MKLENVVSDKIFAIYILYKDNIYRCSNLFISAAVITVGYFLVFSVNSSLIFFWWFSSKLLIINKPLDPLLSTNMVF